MSLYLPEDMKQRVAEAARAHHMSEDAYMREAIARMLGAEVLTERPRPTLPLFEISGEPLTAERIDEILAEGFGENGRG
ncbi:MULTISPECIES: ribbon-helix-helix domain-containing protein [Nonomuraea]|uniref:Ribbon-helix-helix domain-containing protein n=2 Tax=Nonomuraea TaxID=83681 RepID=A0ABW1BXV3_9ACTN|nr:MULTISPECIES: ribbon-helix-helix domain-containing protein [Nonomuraea]MDA0647069.1 ribbon-helix-helix domain-containing protein [Nonomuraea ferruginea]